AGAAAIHPPGFSGDFPEARVDDARVRRVHGEIDGAGVVAALEDLFPGGAAVGGAVDAAHFVRAPEVAERGAIDDVRVLGVNADGADMVGILKADVAPGVAGVDGLVDAVAVGGVAADAGFTHTGVNDVGVGIGDGDGTDGAGFELAVGHGDPGEAA